MFQSQGPLPSLSFSEYISLASVVSCIYIGRTDVEAETPIFWPPDVKSWLIWKDPDAGKDWRQEEKGMTEDEMAGWHHRLKGHEFGWTPGVGDGQGGLVSCSPWGHKELDMTEWLNWALSFTIVNDYYIELSFSNLLIGFYNLVRPIASQIAQNQSLLLKFVQLCDYEQITETLIPSL